MHPLKLVLHPPYLHINLKMENLLLHPHNLKNTQNIFLIILSLNSSSSTFFCESISSNPQTLFTIHFA